MSNEMKYRKEPNYISVAVDSATVIEIGDMVYLDTDDVKPVSTAALWITNLLTTQEALKKIFLGIAMSASASGETSPVTVCTDGVFEMDTASAAYEVGATVAPDKDSGGNNLLDQTVEAVAQSGAIGIVYTKTATATRVMVHFKSVLMESIVRAQSAIVSLTDSTTGTADNTVADVGASFSQATLNNNFADLTAKVNGILTALRGAGIITP